MSAVHADAIVRVYARVEVKIGEDGGFIVAVGEEVIMEKEMEKETEKKMTMEMEVVKEVEMEMQNEVETEKKIEEEMEKEIDVKTFLSSADPITWTLNQQDFTELFFLANNANGGKINDKISTEKEKDKPGKVENIDKIERVEEGDKIVKVDKAEMRADKIEKKPEKKDKSGPLPLLLEMKEPNPETPQGMNEWLSWFELLKTHENAILTILKAP